MEALDEALRETVRRQEGERVAEREGDGDERLVEVEGDGREAEFF